MSVTGTVRESVDSVNEAYLSPATYEKKGKVMSTKNKRRSPRKRRNPEKVVMDKYYHPKTFRSRKRTLSATDADKELKEYMRGDYDS